MSSGSSGTGDTQGEDSEEDHFTPQSFNATAEKKQINPAFF
jgi:hypothetical protein